MTQAKYHQHYDSPWKRVLSVFCQPAIELCFPTVAKEIDWDRGVEFLDKEFERIARHAEVGGKQVDKLLKLWRKDGQEQWILLHVEVQAHWDADLGRRVFEYYISIRQRYHRRVASVVILADENPDWRPASYESELWGCRVRFDFPTVKLLDLAVEPERLLQDPNPFAIVVLAQVQALRTQADAGQRFLWKKRLTQLGYERGYSREQILDLFTFIDWVIILPDELEHQFEQEMTQYEQEQRMEYITTIERRGMERGMEKGRQEGRQEGQLKSLQEAVIEAVEARFGEVPGVVRDVIESTQDVTRLKQSLRQAIQATSLATFVNEVRPN